ncbi:hypothetical protein CUMW_265750 [Citrus unshiu]|uniref:Uncharacterized protein n=1 Tax=Citrus unshiu TaxID=55188 RepID=A0A2H5QVJ7_CITUN|nr:hypothetical protein CUMW_265750 [Citrus unshiu]
MFCDQDVFVANKLLNKPRTLLKIAKQEHLRKMLEKNRAIWLNMILLLSKREYTRELFTKARELIVLDLGLGLGDFLSTLRLIDGRLSSRKETGACYGTDSVYNTANGTLPRVAGERKSNPNSADARPMWTQLSSHLKPDSQNQSSTLEPKTVQHNVVKYMVANANSHAFGYVPQVVREQRKKENCLPIRNQGQIHEGEQKKRSNQIESAGGKMEKYKMAASAILTPKVGYGFADELKTAWFWVRKRFINGKVIRKEVVSVVMEGLRCFEEIGVDL